MIDTDIPASDETAIFGTIRRLEGAEDVSGKRVLFATDEQAAASLPAGSALLIVQHGPPTGTRFPLDTDRTTIGRHPRSNIFLDDVTVPHKHCEFSRGDGGYPVRDIGSLDRTYIDHTRAGSRLLVASEEAQIREFRLACYPTTAQ